MPVRKTGALVSKGHPKENALLKIILASMCLVLLVHEIKVFPDRFVNQIAEGRPRHNCVPGRPGAPS